ncbi:ACT domain-containing protein [Apilactobacillus ozensis]|uniref:ACT domain-containing protein n=1 Tax=Apilactobacillus ozensis TaxID=866801 RepID=UPI0006D18E82|nr:ACT domain-containing protein [Apilactobacillus ozensis]
MNKYYIVDRSILPDSFEKVIEARKLIDTGQVTQISEATKKVGISRGTYYKYKDLVFDGSNNDWDRKAVISFMLDNEKGMLSKVLHEISEMNGSILTINQNIPIHNIASVVISLDISRLSGEINDLIDSIKTIPGASMVKLVSLD